MSGFGLSAMGKLCLLLLFSCDEVFTVAEVVKEALRVRVGLKHPPCVGCLLPDLLNDPYGSVVPLAVLQVGVIFISQPLSYHAEVIRESA